MSLTEIYVDPSIAADSGAGTVGDPYGDLEYAIIQETFDAVNGTRVNIKAGTAEVLTQSIQTTFHDTSVSIAWNSALTAPLVFRGYTSIAGDGGKFAIDAGTFGVVDSGMNYWSVVDGEIYGGSVSYTLRMGIRGIVLRMTIRDGVGSRAILTGGNGSVENCYVYNHAGTGIDTSGGRVVDNYLETGPTNHFAIGVNMNATTLTQIERNIMILQGSAIGVKLHYMGSMCNNSIYSLGGTGVGVNTQPSVILAAIKNNLIEGFSGVGGKGIDLSTLTSGNVLSIGGNAVFDCTTPYDLTPTDGIVDDLGDNEILTTSPFNDAAAGDFSPIDTGSVKEGSLPQGWIN